MTTNDTAYSAFAVFSEAGHQGTQDNRNNKRPGDDVDWGIGDNSSGTYRYGKSRAIRYLCSFARGTSGVRTGRELLSRTYYRTITAISGAGFVAAAFAIATELVKAAVN